MCIVKLGKSCLTAAIAVSVLAANAVSLTLVDAKVPVKVNAPANVVFEPIAGVSGAGAAGNVTADVQKDFNIQLATGYSPDFTGAPTGVSHLPQGRANAGAWAKYSRGNVTLNLPAKSYSNAVISLYSINGKRIFGGSASASKARTFSVSRASVPAGVYLLSVRGADGNSFAARLTHSGDRLNINAAFAGTDNNGLNKSAAAGDYGRWTITVSATGYHTQTRTFKPGEGTNPPETFTLAQAPTTPRTDFVETVGNVTFNMVYIPGGTFNIGCEKSSGCPQDAKVVNGVTVSNYYIGKAEVTYDQWNAVMGGASCNSYYPKCTDPYTNMTWYDAMEFACKLSQMTGRNYRMTTEAEWEYAAKNHVGKLSNIGGGSGVSGEEWAYNSWLATHDGGTDPVGPSSGLYTQKTRRDPNGTADNITGRLIRSVEGVGPALRLALSADTDYPPNYVSPCKLHMPEMLAEPENSYRDSRWVTGSNAHWAPTGAISLGSFDLRVWEDGTARLGSYNGQWFTSNNIAFVFVPSSGTSVKFAYIFLDASQAALISDKESCYFNCSGPGGFVGRISMQSASNYAKPAITGLKSGKELADAAGADFKMVNMANIPSTVQQKDSRLLDGTSQGWFQDNRQAGGVHHYRKDVDNDEFRFTVNQLPNSRTILANGAWFTVNNTFLRVTHPNKGTPYVADYLYAVTSDGTFYHNSFMAYERGDFRMFKKTANGAANSDLWTTTCGDLCSGEIPKGEDASFYAQNGDKGKSTFVPAPCPAGGCN